MSVDFWKCVCRHLGYSTQGQQVKMQLYSLGFKLTPTHSLTMIREDLPLRTHSNFEINNLTREVSSNRVTQPQLNHTKVTYKMKNKCLQ